MRLATLLPLSLLLACGDKDQGSDDSNVEADTDTDTDADSDTDTDADTDLQANASLEGHVMNVDGSPIVGARVNVCKNVCQTATTDSTGYYDFPKLMPWTAAFDVIISSGEYATVLVPMTLADEEDRVIDVTVPRQDNAQPTPTTSTEVNLGGVHVTLKKDDLTLPFGEDGEEVRGISVPKDIWPPFDEITGEVRGVWYLDPYDGKADPGLAYWIDNQAGFQEGASFQAYVADYYNARWDSAGVVTVVGDKLVNDGTGLPILSTLIIVKE